MTVQEAGKILNLLMTAYPHFYQNYTKAERDSLKMFWASLFEQDDVRIVEAAVKSFIQSDEKGFPPVPGQVRAKMRLIVGRNELSAAEAWGMVMDIINPPDENAHFQAYARGVNYTEDCFKKLPPLVQRVVYSPEQLRIWGVMDSRTLNSVVASNFMRNYREIAEKEREFERLPADVKTLVGEMRAGLPDWRKRGYGAYDDDSGDGDEYGGDGDE